MANMQDLLKNLRQMGFTVKFMSSEAEDRYHVEGDGVDVILRAKQMQELHREKKLNLAGIKELAKKFKDQVED